jgi:hypothetical protein
MTDQPATPTPATPVPIMPSTVPQDDALAVLEKAIAAASAQNDAARVAAQQVLQTNQPSDPTVATTQMASVLSQTTPVVGGDHHGNSAASNVSSTAFDGEVIDQSNLDTGELAQVLPQAVLSATDTLNPATATRTAKESAGLITPDNNTQVEAGGGVQAVEQEKNPELSPEVEGFINKVENNADQLPKEIVIADAIKNLPQNHPLPKQAVVIVPITPEIEKEGEKKSPKFSIRWLVEWSRKVMKMFVGRVIYRNVDT